MVHSIKCLFYIKKYNSSPPLESQEPRYLVLSKFWSEMKGKFDIYTVSFYPVPWIIRITHTPRINYIPSIVDYIFQSSWSTRQTWFFIVLLIAQNAPQVLEARQAAQFYR